LSTPHYIRDVQYKDPSNLNARVSIYRFRQSRVNLWESVLALADLTGDERMLDVGCGNGAYLGELARQAHRGLVVGMDLSAGMLPEARTRAPDARLMVGDAQRLPFVDDAFDCALAMHMLYHVPDRAAAIAELRRVVRARGVVLVVTNSVEHLTELDAIVAQATAGTNWGSIEPMKRSMGRFSIESAPAELEGEFAHVDFHPCYGELRITETDPIVAYVSSMRTFIESDPASGAAILDAVRARADELIARDGEVVVRTRAGCFACRA
jgi:ubiquinone/menaquinone biosynthesis C-methylase UbiE